MTIVDVVSIEEEVTTSDVFLENSAVLVVGLGVSQVVSNKIVKNMLVNTLLSCCNIWIFSFHLFL